MYDDFELWLNDVLDKNSPLSGAAVNFNIYEDEDNCWSVQLISAGYFDENDDDWCCEEVFTTGEDLYTWKQASDWMEVLQSSCDMIRKYLEEGKFPVLSSASSAAAVPAFQACDSKTRTAPDNNPQHSISFYVPLVNLSELQNAKKSDVI